MNDMDMFLNVLKKRWRMIVFVGALVAIGTGVYSKIVITPVYRSSVSLYFGRVTESSPMEKLLSSAQNSGSIGSTASELALGSTLTGDYQGLIDLDIIKTGVSDEITKLGKWQNKGYRVSSESMKTSRILRINIDSDDPIYCQAVANIYASEFINKVQQLVGIQNAQIIEEPKLNSSPISPNISRNMLMGFVAGFALSFMAFVALKFFDKTINTSTELESHLNLPVVGTVHKDTEYSVDKKNPILFSGTDESENNRSKIAEDFRVFRVNLINKREENGENGSVIAVTSPYAKEGKTFCTANIGASLAEAGYKVLLIDCDTGERGLQSYFGKTDDKGLMDILSDEQDFDSVVKRNLNDLSMDVLFCGSKNVNSANLMISPKFKKLVNKLKGQYDYAFLDVSTNLGTADIVSAGSSADSVLLLVRAGQTEVETAKETVEALKRAHLDISGVIINGLEEV